MSTLEQIIYLILSGLPILISYLSLGPSKANIFISVFWMIINYLFIFTTWELLKSYIEIFSLKDLKINKTTYVINIITYVSFIIFINFYFFKETYHGGGIIDLLSMPIIVILILLLFLINLLCGIFPKPESERVYSVSNKNSFKFGRDKFRTVIGSYNEGIVVGNKYFKFDDIKSASGNLKTKSILIKGKKPENFIINIDAENSAVAAIDVLMSAKKSDKFKAPLNIKE